MFAGWIVNTHSWPRIVERIDLRTRKREVWTTIDPPEKSDRFEIQLSQDGQLVAYTIRTQTSDLYVIEPP